MHGTTPARQAVLHALAQCRTAGLGHHLEARDRCEHRRAAEAGERGDDASTPELCESLRRIDWVVYAKPPFAGPGGVLAWLMAVLFLASVGHPAFGSAAAVVAGVLMPMATARARQ